MKVKEFLGQLDNQAIVDAINVAERRTSGEVRVFVAHARKRDPEAAARKQFAQLGMTQTALRNGVLIYLAPSNQTFAILGDVAIHQKCGDAFWRTIADELTEHFKAGRYTEGVVHAVSAAGKLLAEHFPRSPDDKNELPNDLAQG